MPKTEDLLSPLGHPGTDYIRGRLKRRVMLELGITMRRPEVVKLLKCLDQAASVEKVGELHAAMSQEIAGSVWVLEMEPLLLETHGAWRYEGRPDVLREDLARAANQYAISHTMDSLLKGCGFPVVRTREERLDDAAWYAIPKHER